MSTEVTAALWGSRDPQLVQVTVTGIPAGHTVDIYREVQGLDLARVRGGFGVTPSTDALLTLDASAPIGRPIVYVVRLTSPTGAVTEVSAAPITRTDTHDAERLGRHVLVDPTTGHAVRVDVLNDPDERRNDARHAVLYPAARSRPVVLHDVRASDTGTLAFTTTDPAATTALNRLLQPGRAVASLHAHDACDIPAGEILALGTVTRSRWGRYGRRVWAADFVVIDEPDPHRMIPSTTLADLHNYVPTTLADIATLWPTLLTLAQDDLETA